MIHIVWGLPSPLLLGDTLLPGSKGLLQASYGLREEQSCRVPRPFSETLTSFTLGELNCQAGKSLSFPLSVLFKMYY